MHLGRRSFLKFLGSALAGAAMESVPTAFSASGYYVNTRLGFGFKIPEGWHLEAFRDDFKSILGGQKLAEQYRGDDQLFDELAEGLMATLSKYPIEEEGPKRFSPSMTFFRDSDECLGEYADLRALAESAHSGFSELLTDYECTHEPNYIDRKDCVMVRSKSKFLFEHEEMNSVLVDNETFLIHYRDRLYTIHLYDSPCAGDVTQEEFDLFRNSLHIA